MAAGVKRATEVFRLHGEDIRAMIALHTRDSAEAEDLFQEFFLSLVSARFPKDIANMKRYLYRAISNDVASHIRSKQRYNHRLKVYAETRRCRRQQEDPSKVAQQVEHTRRVFEMIEKCLPPREARAVSCRFHLNCNLGEAAEHLGVSRRSVAHYVSAGLRKIKEFGLMRERNR